MRPEIKSTTDTYVLCQLSYVTHYGATMGLEPMTPSSQWK